MEKSKVISPNIKDDLIGAKVKHKIFSTGTITSIEKDTEKGRGILRVKFATGEYKFVYPDAFERFLAAEDPDIQRRMIEEIQNIRDAEAEGEEDTETMIPPIGPPNTFVFKNKKMTYKNRPGYIVCDLGDNEVGIVWSHKHKPGELAEGQAEIRFFDEFRFRYKTWRRVFINDQRLYFSELEKKIKDQGSVTLVIDAPRLIY